MPSTLTPTCPFCGLRYANRPLLELHIREDHLQRNRVTPGHPSPALMSYPGDMAWHPGRPAAPMR